MLVHSLIRETATIGAIVRSTVDRRSSVLMDIPDMLWNLSIQDGLPVSVADRTPDPPEVSPQSAAQLETSEQEDTSDPTDGAYRETTRREDADVQKDTSTVAPLGGVGVSESKGQDSVYRPVIQTTGSVAYESTQRSGISLSDLVRPKVLHRGTRGLRLIRVVHKVTGNVYVVKKIPRQRGSPLHELQCMQEANACWPSVIHLVGWDVSEAYVFMIMEYHSHGDLYSLIASNTTDDFMPEYIIRRLFFGLFTTLKTLHQKGLLHRDLKPENLLLSGPVIWQKGNLGSEEPWSSRSPFLILCDFGSAVFIPALIPRIRIPVPNSPNQCLIPPTFNAWEDVEIHSGVHSECGTYEYNAPERQDHGYSGVAAEVWSLGVMLYATVSGSHPFDTHADGSIDRIRSKIRQGQYYRGSKIWPRFSTPLQDLLSRMLQVNPSQRITLASCLTHPWFQGDPSLRSPVCSSPSSSDIPQDSPLESASDSLAHTLRRTDVVANSPLSESHV